jgi:hypothetical protein
MIIGTVYGFSEGDMVEISQIKKAASQRRNTDEECVRQFREPSAVE